MPTTIDRKNSDEKRNHSVLSTANILSVLGLVIAVVYGWIGYNANERMEQLSKDQLQLSKKQDSTSVDLNHFAQLLHKTDSVISLSNSQLLFNQKVQKIANENYKNSEIGSINELESTIFQIQNLYYNSIIYIPNLNYDSSNIYWSLNKLEEMKSLFISDMNNMYLNRNDTLQQLWHITYAELYNLHRQILLRIGTERVPIYNLITRQEETNGIDTTGLKQYIHNAFGNLWNSMGALISVGTGKIKKDKIKLGLLDKNGKSKLNIDGLYIQAKNKKR